MQVDGGRGLTLHRADEPAQLEPVEGGLGEGGEVILAVARRQAQSVERGFRPPSFL